MSSSGLKNDIAYVEKLVANGFLDSALKKTEQIVAHFEESELKNDFQLIKFRYNDYHREETLVGSRNEVAYNRITQSLLRLLFKLQEVLEMKQVVGGSASNLCDYLEFGERCYNFILVYGDPSLYEESQWTETEDLLKLIDDVTGESKDGLGSDVSYWTESRKNMLTLVINNGLRLGLPAISRNRYEHVVQYYEEQISQSIRKEFYSLGRDIASLSDSFNKLFGWSGIEDDFERRLEEDQVRYATNRIERTLLKFNMAHLIPHIPNAGNIKIVKGEDPYDTTVDTKSDQFMGLIMGAIRQQNL